MAVVMTLGDSGGLEDQNSQIQVVNIYAIFTTPNAE